MGRDEASAERFAARAREALSAGNALLGYDLAERALQLGLRTRALHYLSLLSLANAGNSALAWQRYRDHAPPEDEQDEDWLALKGRLLKDLALAGGGAHDFRRAAEAYLAAFRQTGGYFAAVNAASMFLLAGAEREARALAREVLLLAGGLTPADDGERYFLSATEAEAALLLGDGRRAAASLREADRWSRHDLNARSRTRAQLRLICEHLGIEDVYSKLLSLPAVIELERRAAAFAVGLRSTRSAGTGPGSSSARLARSLVYAAISQPADLCAAECFQAKGARLHLVLPAPRKALMEHWQQAYGAGWAMRLARCLEQAADVTATQGFLADEQAWAAAHVGALARGLARLCAQRLGCELQRVELLPAAQPPGFRLRTRRGRDAPDALVPAAASSPERRCVGLIFADIAGFRRLRDADLPRFQSQVMGGIARLIEDSGVRPLFRHTWGDAVNLITEDAAGAARLALAIQACIEGVRRSAGGPLADIELRLAAHYAPVFAGYDPVERQPTFYGTQLSFAARVEPVTPPGMIFVTEAFAARLALEAPEEFRLEYAGEVELAKHFGKYRLFGLRAAPSRARRAVTPAARYDASGLHAQRS